MEVLSRPRHEKGAPSLPEAHLLLELFAEKWAGLALGDSEIH